MAGSEWRLLITPVHVAAMVNAKAGCLLFYYRALRIVLVIN
jgi:hypothetical protein